MEVEVSQYEDNLEISQSIKKSMHRITDSECESEDGLHFEVSSDRGPLLTANRTWMVPGPHSLQQGMFKTSCVPFLLLILDSNQKIILGITNVEGR